MSFYTGGKLRKVVAIGDLHGDYYRILRILEEQQILIPGTLVWDPYSDNVDLVFIGDYVDWRGEFLEGISDNDMELAKEKSSPKGSYRVLWLIRFLFATVEKLRRKNRGFASRIFMLMGNHDDMMMESLDIFKILKEDEIEDIINDTSNCYAVAQKYSDDPNSSKIIESVMRFVNWVVQGGKETILSFGGLSEWRKSLEGDMGEFLNSHLKLGVVINNRLYSHSIPDKKEFWIPIANAGKIRCGEKHKLKEAFLWGRKVWGYDYTTGQRTKPFSPSQLNEMLRMMKVKGVVVGHTPVRQVYPQLSYEGLVVNIDVHGVPGSQPYVEIYYSSGE